MRFRLDLNLSPLSAIRRREHTSLIVRVSTTLLVWSLILDRLDWWLEKILERF